MRPSRVQRDVRDLMVFKDDQYVVHEDGMAESCREMRLVRMEESRMRSRSRRHIREGIISAPRVPYDCGKARGRVGRHPSMVRSMAE